MRNPGAEITFARIFNTRVTSRELLAMILRDFDLASGNSKVKMLHELNDFLIREYEEGRKAVLIIDEAQNLTRDELEEVRMLSNLETDDAKLLQIMLVGQPELQDVLVRPELRQLRQRISIACHLRPLDRRETELYILHRLGVAGNREALVFSEGAFDGIFDVTGGIPRQINRLCDFLLLTAYAEGKRDVAAGTVQEIAEEIGIDLPDRGEDRTAQSANLARPASGNGGSDGKRVLLRALGVPFGPVEQTDAGGADGQWAVWEGEAQPGTESGESGLPDAEQCG